MSREEYLSSLRAAIDAMEVHLEKTNIFTGSLVEKTAKFQELVQTKSRAYNLMLEELDVLCRDEMRRDKKTVLMTEEQQNELAKRVKQYTSRRKNE